MCGLNSLSISALYFQNGGLKTCEKKLILVIYDTIILIWPIWVLKSLTTLSIKLIVGRDKNILN